MMERIVLCVGFQCNFATAVSSKGILEVVHQEVEYCILVLVCLWTPDFCALGCIKTGFERFGYRRGELLGGKF